MLLHAYDQNASAGAFYARARALDPGAFEWAYLAGLLALRTGRPDEAVPALRDAVRLRPGSAPARVRLGEGLLASGQADEAAVVYRGLLRDDARLPQAHYGLGRALAAAGRLDQAVERYQAATRLFAAYGGAHYALGLALRDLGRAAGAHESLALYERHRMDAPPLADPAFQDVLRLGPRAREALDEGVRLSQAGDLEGAIREHERALAADPHLVRAHANLVGLFAHLRRWGKVDEHYRAAVVLGSPPPELDYNYGLALQQQGRGAEAAEVLRRALESSPLHAGAHNTLGTVLEAEGKLPEAEEHYRQAVANQAGYREARFNLGRVLLARGRPREAVAQFEVILEPDDAETPRYLFALAAAYARAGERDKAVEQGERALRRAQARGQAALAASIARDLERLRAAPAR
jgi:tetratricopeptide (TPR) repeat protein